MTNTEATPKGIQPETSPGHTEAAVAIEAMTAHSHRVTSWNYYLESIKQDTVGPLREGLYPGDMDKVLGDARTVCVSLGDDDKSMSWPLMTPITNYEEYLPGYFDRMPEGRDGTYYLSLPSRRQLESRAEQEAVGRALFEHMSGGALLVYDEYDGQRKDEQIREYISHIYDAEIQVDGFIDKKNNTPAAVVHFSAPVKLKANADMVESAEQSPQEAIHHTEILNHDPDDALVDKLWDIYLQQFESLVENFPQHALTRSRDTFHDGLKDPVRVTIVHFEGEEPVAVATFTDNLAACPWLNQSFYQKAFPGEDLLYFEGIASHPGRRGAIYSAEIVKEFLQLVKEVGRDFRLVNQCTNISAGYIPRIVKSLGYHTDIVDDISVTEFARYNYRGVRLANRTQA